jgi:hypothetical protein
MRNLVFLILLVGFNASAGLPPTTIKGQDDATASTKFNIVVPSKQLTNLGGVNALIETGNLNLLKNPSFEASTFNDGWTATSLASVSLDITNVSQGVKAIELITNSGAGEVFYQSAQPTNGGINQIYEASCRVYGGASTLQICGVEGSTERACKSFTGSGVSEKISVEFKAQLAGIALRLRIKQLSGGFQTFTLDDCYLGLTRRSGTVVTNNTSMERMERVSVSTCTSSPCTISSQSGSWVTSVTRSSTGLYAINFASGIFSSAPTCITNATVSPPGTVSALQGIPTTSSVSVGTRNISDVQTDYAFSTICMGPQF